MAYNRRQFLGRSLALGVGASALGACSTIARPLSGAASAGAGLSLAPRDVVVFQGDSITDAGRDKESQLPNERRALGSGYALLAAAGLLKAAAGKDVQVYNRGISGNKVFQLAARWQADCVNLKPKVLSILVGVNDYWHMHNKKYDGTLAVYERDYRALLQTALQQLPDVKLVIGEPFALLGGTSVDASWFPEFDAYRAVARKLAGEFGAIFIPYHDIFTKAAKDTGPAYWTADGVHPTLAGSALMAQAWLDHVVRA